MHPELIGAVRTRQGDSCVGRIATLQEFPSVVDIFLNIPGAGAANADFKTRLSGGYDHESLGIGFEARGQREKQ